jgi:hypothetical protein
MPTSGIYTAIAIGVLLVIVVVAFILGRREPHNNLTPLAGLAFGFIIAGILFGGSGLLGYGMMGIGLILLVIDVIRRRK